MDKLSEQNLKIDKAYLVSCTNSRASDLAAAAKVFKDAVKQTGGPVSIPEGVKLYLAVASLPEQTAAEDAGDWQVMLDAGAIALPAGCGPCIGLAPGSWKTARSAFRPATETSKQNGFAEGKSLPCEP